MLWPLLLSAVLALVSMIKPLVLPPMGCQELNKGIDDVRDATKR